MGSINYATAPFRYLPAKHANEITVQLNGIDHVKGEEHQTDCGQRKDNLIDLKRHLAPRRRQRLRKKRENGDRKNEIQRKKNPDSDKARPEFVAAKIGMPCLFGGKARSSRRLLHPPVLEANPNIPPA